MEPGLQIGIRPIRESVGELREKERVGSGSLFMKAGDPREEERQFPAIQFKKPSRGGAILSVRNQMSFRGKMEGLERLTMGG